MQILRVVTLVVVLSLSAGGCSVKMMYNNMDRLARWSASDYVDMNPAQQAYFNAEIDAMLYWHRAEELPRYAAYLGSLETTLHDGTNPAEVQGVFDSLYSWWEAIEQRAMPMLTEMLLSLSDAQVADLPSRFIDDNEELQEDESDKSLEEVQETWANEYADIFKRFAGKLTREQRDHIAGESVRYVPQFGLWAEYRRRWQGDLMALIQEGRDDPDRFANEFGTLIANREAYYGKELSAVFDANEALAREVTAWMLNHLTLKQRERFITRVGELADDFHELAAQLPEQPPPSGGCLVRCPAISEDLIEATD